MRPARLTVVLYLVALVLACGCIVGGVLSYRHHQRDADAAADPGGQAPSVAEQDRYGAVQKAADATALAMTNIDYRKPGESVRAVAALSTGSFEQQYQTATQSLVKLVRQYRSVLSSTVSATAVSDVDADSATVLVATSGTVSNAQTGKQSRVSNFRLVLSLQLVDGQWRTSDLAFAA